MRPMPLLILPLAVFALAACQKPEAPAPVEATTPPPAVTTPPPLPAPPDATPIDASYACEGNRVDLLDGRAVARIAMSDGRVVNLGAMRGSVPATWRDVGLSFTLDERQAQPFIELAQDNGPTLRCEALSPIDSGPDGASANVEANEAFTPVQAGNDPQKK